MNNLDTVRTIVADTLELGERGNALSAETPLLGSIPELDSMAVVHLITALEEHYGFTVEDDEIEAETFSTVGTLVAFVDNKLAA